MKTYRIPVTWAMRGIYIVEAETLDDAVSRVAVRNDPPEEGVVIVPGSLNIDLDTAAEYADEDHRPDPESECQNCGQRWPFAALKEIQHIHQRVAPGEPMPSGECPDCGALCQPLDPKDDWEPTDLVVPGE